MNGHDRNRRQGQTSEMTTFVIDTDNNIIAFASQQEAEAVPGDRFASQEQLTELAANWPAGRLADIWNSISGLTPVKKFTDRKSGITRIWKAIQSLNGSSPAEPAPEAATQPKKAKRAGDAKPARAAKTKPAKSVKAKAAKGGKSAAKAAGSAREGSKKAEVLGLLQRKGGATLQQIMPYASHCTSLA
jgi:hypothetical protein